MEKLKDDQIKKMAEALIEKYWVPADAKPGESFEQYNQRKMVENINKTAFNNPKN